ncbi:hypothetical protein [Burkholderia plantarii]|uniref:hypothetical protein n=1 Tax=Burkholderia plantarii TaxID=41899 RepID=UPI0018DD4E44|nr:hypothetical protein [Burkholderia plantarii]MBI0328347.1 hypothetical protein [Burkholderia plantarii]
MKTIKNTAQRAMHGINLFFLETMHFEAFPAPPRIIRNWQQGKPTREENNNHIRSPRREPAVFRAGGVPRRRCSAPAVFRAGGVPRRRCLLSIKRFSNQLPFRALIQRTNTSPMEQSRSLRSTSLSEIPQTINKKRDVGGNRRCLRP